MRWSVKPDDGWRNWFALIPVKIGGEWFWLEWFQRRFAGDYYEVRPVPTTAKEAVNDDR